MALGESFLRLTEKYLPIFLIGVEKNLRKNIAAAEQRKNEIHFPAANLLRSVKWR